MSTIMKENVVQKMPSRPEVKVIAERCAGCQECIIRCPTEALSMDMDQWIAVADNKLCVGCRQCERTCPFNAIRVDGMVMVADRKEPSSEAKPVSIGDISPTRPGFASLEEAVKEAERCLNCPDPTCMRGCPAHNDIPGFVAAIRERDLEKAQKIISQTSCLPDICSRVCNWAAQCEGACNWALAGGEPVAIGKLEQFVTDYSTVPPLEVTSERARGLSVAIVGSGPAGIAAAWELASAGATATMYERGSVPGGVIQWGIPPYVLPDSVAQRPIKALVDDGVKFHLNTEVTPQLMESLLKTHDAVIVAVGAPVADRPKIPGSSLEGVIDATTFLTKARKALVRGETLAEIQGARILVLGGSNTAFDVARSAVRLGGQPVIVYRRKEAFSSGRKDEIAEAKREGVEFRFETNVASLEGEGGKVKRATLVRTHQKSPDKIPTPIKGTEELLDVDMVVLAIGYKLDPGLSANLPGLPLRPPMVNQLFPDRRWLGSGIMTDKKLIGRLSWDREYALRASRNPRRDNLWIVGDALTGPSTIVGSMAEGKMAAQAIIQRYLRSNS